MSPDTTRYDAMYAVVSAAFGAHPDPLLAEHWRRLDPALPVLDVGCGQGRNALFLAQRGLTVVGIDPSEVAAGATRAAATAEGAVADAMPPLEHLVDVVEQLVTDLAAASPAVDEALEVPDEV